MILLIKSISGTRNVEVNEKCIVKDLKEQIEKFFGISPEEQELTFEDVVLNNDGKLLTSYGIKSDCNIVLNIYLNEFTVIIKYNKQINHIKINRNETGVDLKKKIQMILNKPVSGQLLLYREKSIEDKEKLSIYGLTEESVIILLDKVTEELHTLVLQLNEKDFLNIQYADKISVSEVLKKIEEKLPDKNMEHSILFKDKVLKIGDIIEKNNNSVFQSLKIQTSISKSIIQLLVVSNDNKTTTFQISKKLNCIELKKMIRDKLGMSVESQGLSFNGISLENDKSLEYHGLADNSVVNLCARLRGG